MSKHAHNQPPAQRLAKACEPVFDYIGESNRLARRGSARSAKQVREELSALFAEVARAAAMDHDIASLLVQPQPAADSTIAQGEATLAMMCFADHTLRMREPTWKPLAGEHGFATGDKAFVDGLDSALKSNDEQRQPVLAVYYTCIGLGYGGTKTFDLNWMRDTAARLGQKLGGQFFGGGIVDRPVSDQPYKATYLGDHRPKAGGRVSLMLGIFAGLVLLLLGFSVAAYHGAEGKIRQSLTTIMQAAGAESSE